MEGREALIEWLAPLFEQYHYEFSLSHVDVRQFGDWAVEEADFQSILHSKRSNSEGPLIHEGRYLMIWARTSDGWLIDRYVDRTGRHPTREV